MWRRIDLQCLLGKSDTHYWVENSFRSIWNLQMLQDNVYSAYLVHQKLWMTPLWKNLCHVFVSRSYWHLIGEVLFRCCINKPRSCYWFLIIPPCASPPPPSSSSTISRNSLRVIPFALASTKHHQNNSPWLISDMLAHIPNIFIRRTYSPQTLVSISFTKSFRSLKDFLI